MFSLLPFPVDFGKTSSIRLTPKKEFLAVSSTLRAHPEYKQFFAWLEKRKPAAFLGYTLFVYDITNDIESVLQLAKLYYLSGRLPSALRQTERALHLDPQNSEAHTLSQRLKEMVQEI